MNWWPILAPGAAAGVTAGMGAWGAVAPWSQLYGPTLRHNSSRKAIALTFDDGPNPAVTPRLLDLFDRYSVRASFFVIGRFARACPEIVRETVARGHMVGNHTDTHTNLTFLSRSHIRQEIARCQDAIAFATRRNPPEWMRPPGGRRSPLLQSEIGRADLQGVMMWSFSSRDWKPQPLTKLVARLSLIGRRRGSHGEIVLFHDGKSSAPGYDRHNTIAALEYWLPRWRDAGFTFVTGAPGAVAAPMA